MRTAQVSPLLVVCLALGALAWLGPAPPAATGTAQGTAESGRGPQPLPTASPSTQAKVATAAELAELREQALSAEDPFVAGAAVTAIGRFGALAGDAGLLDLLRDRRPQVREAVVIGLGLANDPRAVPELQKVATGDEAALRPLALQGLGQLGITAAAALADLEARGGWTPAEAACLRQALQDAMRGAPGTAGTR